MGLALGEQLVTNCPVTAIDPINRIINNRFHYDRLVTTIPWPTWRKWNALPVEIDEAVSCLVHTSVDVDYSSAPEAGNLHWLYEPGEKIPHHRVLFRQNFCEGSRGSWTETNARRSIAATGFRHRNEFAYPVNTLGKPEAVKKISQWAAANHILPLGRWGTWEHMNSDIAVDLALKAVQSLNA
jgi:hypothetical protein